MRERYLWLVIAVLLVLTLGQACYIYVEKAAAKEISQQPPVQPETRQLAYSEKASDSQWAELQKWREKVRSRINSGSPVLPPDFDSFFNDTFFSGKPDPFDEMERIRNQMSGVFRGAQKNSFDDYWNKWFEQRMRMGQFSTVVSRTDKDITLTIHVAGLAANTADVNITNERIKISFTVKTASEEKNAGVLVRSGSVQSYVKILPVPEDAEPGTGKAEISGDAVKIKFDLKKRER